MEEIKCLNLSTVPESFRQKLSQYSTNVQRLVENFKESILQYEKSMGKDSKRGLIRSAPRKVQWAFLAVEDLKKIQERSQKSS